MSRAVSLRVRFQVMTRDRFTCQYCGSRPPKVEIRVDHIHPVAGGGSNDTDNLITACFECNAGKRDDVIPGFREGRQVWELVRRLPRSWKSDADAYRDVTDFAREFARYGLEDLLVRMSQRSFPTWEDWHLAVVGELHDWYASFGGFECSEAEESH